MARVFTIDKIEGNSYIGVPVFSNCGKMSNYEYIVFTPQKPHVSNKEPDEGNNNDEENYQFKVKGAVD
jgi:hypothetical protein